MTVCELSRKGAGVQGAFSPRELFGLARRLAHARRLDALHADLFGIARVLRQVTCKLFVDQRFHEPLDLAVAQARLGLTLKLRFRHFDADDRRQPLAHILSLKILLVFFQQSGLDRVVVDGSGQGGLEPNEVSPSFAGVDVIGKRKDVF